MSTQQSLNQQLLAAMAPMTESASTRRAFERQESRRQARLAKKQARALLHPPKPPKPPKVAKAPRVPRPPRVKAPPRFKPYKPPRVF